MKLIPFIRPVSRTKKEELEFLLEEERRKFRESSQNAVSAWRDGYSLKNGIRNHPLEIALCVIVGGFLLARHLARLKNTGDTLD